MNTQITFTNFAPPPNPLTLLTVETNKLEGIMISKVMAIGEHFRTGNPHCPKQFDFHAGFSADMIKSLQRQAIEIRIEMFPISDPVEIAGYLETLKWILEMAIEYIGNIERYYSITFTETGELISMTPS